MVTHIFLIIISSYLDNTDLILFMYPFIELVVSPLTVMEKNKRINPIAKVESKTAGTFDDTFAAAQTCPTKAILIIDRYTGEQIYP